MICKWAYVSICVTDIVLRDDDAYDKIGNQYRQLFNIIPALRNDLEYFARNTLRMHQFTTLVSILYALFSMCSHTYYMLSAV